MKIKNANVVIGDIIEWKTRAGGSKWGVVSDVIGTELYHIEFYNLLGEKVGDGSLAGKRQIRSKFSDIVNALVAL